MAEDLSISQLNGKEIYLPDGRLLGIVGETVVDGTQLSATPVSYTHLTLPTKA